MLDMIWIKKCCKKIKKTHEETGEREIITQKQLNKSQEETEIRL